MTIKVDEEFKIIIDEEKYLLYSPFIDNNFNLSFRRNSLVHPSFSIIFNHKINDIIVINGNEEYESKIDKIVNKEFLLESIKTRNIIMTSIKECSKEFINKSAEILILFNPKDKDCDNKYIFTTEPILNNEYYSCKYMNSFIYYLNEDLKKCNIVYLDKSNYTTFQLKLNRIFKNINMLKLKEEDFGIDKCYRVPYKDFIKLITNKTN